MMRLTLRQFREIAWAASTDAGNRSMRKAGRSAWSRKDYNVAVGEFNRLWLMSREREYARARFEGRLDVAPQPAAVLAGSMPESWEE